MFDRFTDRARKVMALANQEARRLRHAYIAPEHVLLGLLREGAGVGASVLKELGVELKSLRITVTSALPAQPDVPVPDALPQSHATEILLRWATEEMRGLRHQFVGTEHLLLALVRGDGLAGQLLRARGVTYECALEIVVEMLGRGEEDPGHAGEA